MKTINVSVIVDGETHGFSYHFVEDPKKEDLDVLIGNAVREYLSDLGNSGHYSELTVSLCP